MAIFIEVHSYGHHFANLAKFEDISLADGYTIIGHYNRRRYMEGSCEDFEEQDILYRGEQAPQIMQKIKEALENQNSLITPDDFQ